jgi:transposase-like protein
MTSELKPPKEPPSYSAHQRAQAVLAVWTERRRPAQVCQEMGISAARLAHWEERALAGMLKALEPQARLSQKRGSTLSAKLERLLARQAQQAENQKARREKPLGKLPEPKPSSASPTK